MSNKLALSKRANANPDRSQEHKIEIIGGLCLLLISVLLPKIGISTDVAWFAGITSVLLALTVAVLKEHLSLTIERLVDHRISINAKLSRTATLLSGIDGLAHQFGVSLLDGVIRDLEQIRLGTIPLDRSNYFQQLVNSMSEAPSKSVVLAVNCIDELRWLDDPRQTTYFEENVNASARGVRIQRLFIVDRKRLNDADGAGRIQIIKAQLEHKTIVAHVVWRDTLRFEDDIIKDWTLFSQPNERLYRDFPDRVDGTRVAHATLIVSPELIEKYREDFRALLNYKISPEEFLGEVTKNLPPNKT